MSWVTLIFPVAAVIFLAILFIRGFQPALPEGDRIPLPGSEHEDKITKWDRRLMLAISVIYGVTAFVNLGVDTAPQTFCKFQESGQYALVELDEPTELGAIMYYGGLYSGNYRLQFSADAEQWTDQPAMEQAHGDLFKWQCAQLNEDNAPVRYVRITADSKLWLGEVALYDAEMQPIDAAHLHYDSGCAKLFDEPETVPEAPSYLNSAYFDEIYHARTAYENVVNEYPYEVSHPPLGKLIISLGIRLFGMTPFGWRSMGTLFGVLMLPALYYFLKKLFGSTSIAACCTAVFAFDFMHFTQTRIATIDTYAVFFIILMYTQMYLYLRADRRVGAPRKAWLAPLALSGLFFGLGAACKWTCLYAGGGLGVLWLLDRIRWGVVQCRDGRKWHYIRETAEITLWSLLFFVIIPCLIYYISYYPYGKASGLQGLGMFFTRDYGDIVLENQKFMFTYHSGVTATHPYSSRWYQWVLDIRPILYYLNYFDDGTRSSFGAFVNPMLCWGGLFAMLSMVLLAVRYRDRQARFILVGYLAQLLPWVLVTRVVFEYHYFPSTVFLLLALGRCFALMRRYNRRWRRWLYSFTAVSLLLFAVFYPVLSGARIPAWYGDRFLCWIPGCWPF